MHNEVNNNTLTHKSRLIFIIVLIEYLLFIFSGTSFSFLHSDVFFSLEADPLFWIFYLVQIPQFILKHQLAAILLDAGIVALLLLFIRNPGNNKLAIYLFILLLLFYVTLMGYLAHRNYQVGFFMVFIPFLFKKKSNGDFASDATRYFILFFYLSAAILKLLNNSMADPAHFSHLLSGQFTPYYLEGNTGLRTHINLYLIEHPAVSWKLFIASFIIESTMIIGFFTRRFDKWLGIGLLTFHFGNWLIMDIAPFGQIAFICLLFLSRRKEL